MARGPGPRHFTRPESARSRSTGEALPLAVIPLAYRNDRESRALIGAGKIASPWRDVPWDIDNWGEPPCEVYGLRPFDRSVADPERLDRLAASVVRMVSPGPVDAEAARLVLAEVPEFGNAAGALVRRLAAEALWAELDAAELLERLVGQFAYADGDLSDARRCIRALAAIGGQNSRVQLVFISWKDWPGSIQQWAAQELQAKGQYIPPPGALRLDEDGVGLGMGPYEGGLPGSGAVDG